MIQFSPVSKKTLHLQSHILLLHYHIVLCSFAISTFPPLFCPLKIPLLFHHGEGLLCSFAGSTTVLSQVLAFYQIRWHSSSSCLQRRSSVNATTGTATLEALGTAASAQFFEYISRKYHHPLSSPHFFLLIAFALCST